MPIFSKKCSPIFDHCAIYVKLLLHFALMAGSSSQLTGVDYSSAAASQLLSVLGIIDAQTSLLHNYPLSPPHSMIFRLPLFICPGTFSSLTFLTKLVLSVLPRCPSHLSLVSPILISAACTRLVSTFFIAQHSDP